MKKLLLKISMIILSLLSIISTTLPVMAESVSSGYLITTNISIKKIDKDTGKPLKGASMCDYSVNQENEKEENKYAKIKTIKELFKILMTIWILLCPLIMLVFRRRTSKRFGENGRFKIHVSIFSKTELINILKKREDDSIFDNDSVHEVIQVKHSEGNEFKIKICKSADYGKDYPELVRYQLKVYKNGYQIDQEENLTKDELINKVLKIN